MSTTKIVVSLPGEKDYDVRIGKGVLSSLGAALRTNEACAQASSVLILTDANIAPLYLQQVKEVIGDSGYKVHDITVEAGETSKSIEVAGEIWEAMVRLSCDRDCVVVSLGGGVVGDLAGFVAACFMRGVPVVHVPTTLLSMVDSSVGGKTGIDLASGKNLVGAFKQPAYVCADTSVLSTLPDQEWTCGLAEVAKSAAIDSDEFFFWLMDSVEDMVTRDENAITEAISRCVVFKADVVAKDKTESSGIRECLNYGHTYGHAVETLSGYGTYSHGAAVAEGMRFAARLGEILRFTSSEFVEAQKQLLDALGLHKLPFKADPDAVVEAMRHDKKTRGGELRFVLLRDVGDWDITAAGEDAIEEYVRLWNEDA